MTIVEGGSVRTRTGYNRLEAHLRERRDGGRKLLVPYVTGGVRSDWTDLLRAYADAGADAIEIGLPFSDPMLDGPTLQQASHTALGRGATVAGILAETAGRAVDLPLIAFTYANLVGQPSDRFVDRLRLAGVDGLIVPDLPVEESVELEAVTAAAGVDLVLLASAVTPGPRLELVAKRSRGFVYAVSVMGTTGERSALAASAGPLAHDLRRCTDTPVLLGFGISSPEHAAEAARAADGVVIGAALMRRVLDGATPTAVGAWLSSIRHALDRA